LADYNANIRVSADTGGAEDKLRRITTSLTSIEKVAGDALSGTVRQYENLLRLGRARMASNNSETLEAVKGAKAVTRAQQLLNIELKAQNDLLREARGLRPADVENKATNTYRTTQNRKRFLKAETDDAEALQKALQDLEKRQADVSNADLQARKELLAIGAQEVRQVIERTKLLQRMPKGFGLDKNRALPNSEMLGADSRGIQRLSTEEDRFNNELAQSVERLQEIDRLEQSRIRRAEKLRNIANYQGTSGVLPGQTSDIIPGTMYNGPIGPKPGKNFKPGGGRSGGVDRGESLALGIGFPLLFGAGPASILGGAAGSFIGDSGFGGQILLSAIGGIIDKFAAGIAKIGLATNDLTGNFNELQQAMVFTSRTQEQQIKLLLDAGRVQEAANAIQNRLNDVVGAGGTQDLQKVGIAADELSRAWGELTLQMQAALAGPLGTILKLISGGVKQQTATNDFNRAMFTDNKAFTEFVQKRNKQDNMSFTKLLNPEVNASRRTQLAREFLNQPQYNKGGNAQLSPEEAGKARKAAEATADKIQSAYREGFALQQKGQDLERQAVDMRRSFENEVFNRRQEIARLEISNQRQAAQVQIEAADLALRKQFSGAEGFEAQVLGAAREYVKSTAEGQADLESKRRTLDLDLAKIRKGVQDYEYSVQQQINSFVRSTEQYKMDVADYQLKMSRQINDEARLTAAATGAGNPAGAYMQGGIGPRGAGQYGPHFDIAKQGGGFYARTALDNYVSVNGKPLSSGSTVNGGEYGASRDGGSRTHMARDYAFGGKAALTLKNGAKWMGSTASSYGDNAVFQTPDGQIYRIIHGKFNGSVGSQLMDAKNNIRPTAPGGIPGAPRVSGLGNELEAATQKQVELEAKLSKLKQDGALFALKQAAEGPRVIQQKTDELNLVQAEANSLRVVSQQEQERLTRSARNNEILKQTAAENERILKALKPQLNADSYKQVEAALSTRLDLKRQELAIDQQTLALAQQRQFIEQRSGLQSQLGVVGKGFQAGYIGNAASTYESALMQYGDMGKAQELADLTRQLDLARISNDAFNQSIQGIGDAFSQSMAEGVGSLTTGAASAQQIFANMLNAMASALLSAATKMIAQYIAIGIARMFAGLGTSGSAGPALSDLSAPASITNPLGDLTGIGASYRAAGGPVSGGSPYIVGEKGPELFVPSRSGSIVPNHALGGGGTTNVVVNVDASGSNVQGDASQAKQLGAVISMAVQAELVKQKRPGGILA